jgi:hypothetical protein
VESEKKGLIALFTFHFLLFFVFDQNSIASQNHST